MLETREVLQEIVERCKALRSNVDERLNAPNTCSGLACSIRAAGHAEHTDHESVDAGVYTYIAGSALQLVTSLRHCQLDVSVKKVLCLGIVLSDKNAKVRIDEKGHVERDDSRGCFSTMAMIRELFICFENPTPKCGQCFDALAFDQHTMFAEASYNIGGNAH